MRKSKPFSVALAAFGLVAAAFVALAAAASPTLDRIKASGAISFGYRDNAVPFSYKDRKAG